MNKQIEELYYKLDAQDKIINTQALEIARLNNHNEELEKEKSMYKNSFEEMSKNYFELQQKIDKALEVVRLCNTKCSKEVIEILKGDVNE